MAPWPFQSMLATTFSTTIGAFFMDIGAPELKADKRRTFSSVSVGIALCFKESLDLKTSFSYRFPQPLMFTMCSSKASDANHGVLITGYGKGKCRTGD